MLCTGFNITETNPSGFNKHLLINKCVTAHSLKPLLPLSPRLSTFRYKYFWLYRYNTGNVSVEDSPLNTLYTIFQCSVVRK
jgi:hypothetical protein